MISVVKFESPTCGPCKVVQGTLDRLKDAFTGKDVEFVKVDITAEENGRYSYDLWGVTKVPTVLIVKDGVELKRYEGALFRYAQYEEGLKGLVQP